MKRTILTMIIALALLITAGAASAEPTVLYLSVDETTVNPATHEGISDCDNYSVKISYEDNIMDVTVIKPAEGEIHEVALNLAMYTMPNTVRNVTVGGSDIAFSVDQSPNYAKLGDFNTNVSLGNAHPTAAQITFENDIVLTPNNYGFEVAAHIGGITSISGVDSLKLGNGDCDGGQSQETPIPEFPTIALPIAAIIGLAFVMQRRKE